MSDTTNPSSLEFANKTPVSRRPMVAFGLVVLLIAAGLAAFGLLVRPQKPTRPNAPASPPPLEVVPAAPEIASDRPKPVLTQEQLYDGLTRAILSDDYAAFREYAEKITPVDREMLAKAEFQSRPSLLAVAVRHGNRTMLEQVISNRVALDQPDREGRRAIHIAALEGRSEMLVDLVTLLKTPIDSRVPSTDDTPLHLAASAGQVGVMGKIIELDAQTVNLTNLAMRSPLHEAVAAGQVKAAEMLLTIPMVERNARDSRRRTPIHLAAVRGDADMVRLLLHHGLARDATDKDGKTASELATEAGFIEIAGMLK